MITSKLAISYISTADQIFAAGSRHQLKQPHDDPKKVQSFLACLGISLPTISAGASFSSDQETQECQHTIEHCLGKTKQYKMTFTMGLKVEQCGKGASIWQAGIRLTKLIKEGVNQSLQLLADKQHQPQSSSKEGLKSQAASQIGILGG